MVKKHIKHIKKHGPKTVALVVVLSAAVAVGVYVGNRIFNKKVAVHQKPAAVVTYSTDQPSEIKPDKKTYQWNGAPNEPKFIKSPKISLDGFVQKVGVDQNKAIAVPDNIHVAGWFNQTVLPGQAGLSIIDGHVDGRVSREGVFSQLSNLKENDTFSIEFGDGSTKQFKVKKNVSVLNKDAAGVLFSQEPGITKQLNLISCIGTFDTKSKTYDHRQIVIAEAM